MLPKCKEAPLYICLIYELCHGPGPPSGFFLEPQVEGDMLAKNDYTFTQCYWMTTLSNSVTGGQRNAI